MGRTLKPVAFALVLSALVACLHTARADAADPVIAAVGDIACSSTTVQTDRCHQKATSDLVVNAGLSAVLPLGDLQYQDGTLSEFMNSYDKSWGRVKSITYPAVGNHEYQTAGASGYFDYFNGAGVQAGRAGDRSKGYYSFDIGSWHLISLNSSDKCTIISCAAGSSQETWLKADLAAHPNYCTLAYWHHPSFNSGNGGNLSAIKPLLQDLYDANAEIILGGHAHHYERFAPQNPSGSLDNARGIRQFVVGTGGAFWTSIGTPKPNSQVRQNTTYGVLKLTLHATSYDWQFVPEAGKTFTDAGSTACHGTAPPADTTKPSAPGNLRATAGTGQVALAWNASTDNVGVTGYQVFRNGATTPVATVGGTTTSYTDAGLAPGPYSYTVRAVDAAGNISDPSNSASATVADTTKPSAPANLSATPGTAQVALSWGASTDNVGVTGYQVFRNGGTTPVATVGGTTTSYTDTGLAPGPYSYTVKAVDAAGNVSDPSNTASTTVADTTKPSAPGNLRATAGTGQVALVWNASTDNVGVTGYQVFRNGGATPVATVGGTTTSYTDTGLAPGAYSYTVKAVDAAGNASDPSNGASATVLDTTKPSAPGNLTASKNGLNQVDLAWNASTDNVGVSGYNVYRDGALIATTSGPGTSYSDTIVLPLSYSYEVRALDAAGNESDPSNTATVSFLPADIEKPSAPANLNADVSAPHTVDLAWDPSTDNVGVTGYQVFRDGSQVASIGTTTSWSDTGVAPGSHDYEVRARDAASNVSDPSNTASATVPDERPSAPTGLTATGVSATQIDLSWQAASDDVAVTGYNVYRDGNLIDTIAPATSYSDTGLPAGSYSYVVVALDGAGNLSEPSNASSATVPPPDVTKPSAPANLVATPGTAQVSLTWDASTDDVGVVAYRVFRGTTDLGTVDGTTTSYTDTGLAAGPYSYTVRALDAAGNASDASNSASATVPDTSKPTAPQALVANASSATQVDLSWQASSDDVGVTGYQVYRDGGLLATTTGTGTSYSDTTVAPNTTYGYEVRALDAAGNLSDPSGSAPATTPVAAQTLTLTPEADARVEQASPATNFGTSYLRADFSTGTSNVESYLRFSLSGVAPGSVRSAKLRLHTLSSGTVDGPTMYLTGTTWNESTINWNTRPARTSGAVADAGAMPSNSWVDVDVTPAVTGSGTYSFDLATVSTDGVDISSREDAAFTPQLIVTTGAPDTEKPTPPGTLTANAASPTEVDLGWLASSDNVGVTGYNVYRGGTLLAPLGVATSYADTSVSPSTTYNYAVRALDAAGNVSDPSNSASATTPSAPTVLTLSPEADAKVQQSSPTTNYATANLGADFSTSTSNVESFLRFTVSGAPSGSVVSAKLRLHSTSDGTADGPAVYTAGSTWSETAVNWNTRPAATSAARDDKGAIPASTWVEYDVTPFVTGNGTYTFRLATSSTDGVYFSQREATSFQPELVLTLH